MMVSIQPKSESPQSRTAALLLSLLAALPSMSGCGGPAAVTPTKTFAALSHAEAAAEIVRLGGHLGPRVIAVKGQYVDITLGQAWNGRNEDLVLLSYLEWVNELSLQGEAFDDSSLPFLLQAHGLQVLRLSHTKLTSPTIGQMVRRNVNCLRVLDLNGPECDDASLAQLISSRLKWLITGPQCQISDEALRDVGKLKGLLFLQINVAAITGEQLEQLKGLGNLRGLVLAGTSVTDVAIPHLKHLTALEYLDLSSTRVSGESLQNLACLEHLNTLVLDETPMTRAGLKHLAELPALEAVSLNGTVFVDEDMELLGDLSHPAMISMDDTLVTTAGIAVLRKINSLLTATDGAGNTYIFQKSWAAIRGGQLYSQKQGQLFLWTDAAPQPVTKEPLHEFWNERTRGTSSPAPPSNPRRFAGSDPVSGLCQ